MKRLIPEAEAMRLRRERDEARELAKKAIEHRDAMQRDLDAMSKRLAQRIDRNNEVWLAATKLPGGLEALRKVPWTA